MGPALACPKREDLQRLIRGELPQSDADRLTQHVGCCPACAAALRSLHGEGTLPPAVPVAPVDVMASDAAPADPTRPSLAAASEGALAEPSSDSG
jgi:anti-sigma factor RsiW